MGFLSDLDHNSLPISDRDFWLHLSYLLVNPFVWNFFGGGPVVAKEVNLYPTLSTSQWRGLCSTLTFVRRCDSMHMSDQTQDINLVGLPYVRPQYRSAPCNRHNVHIHAGIGTTPGAWYCGTLTHQNPPLPTPVVPSTRVTLLLQSLGPTY